MSNEKTKSIPTTWQAIDTVIAMQIKSSIESSLFEIFFDCAKVGSSEDINNGLAMTISNKVVNIANPSNR